MLVHKYYISCIILKYTDNIFDFIIITHKYSLADLGMWQPMGNALCGPFMHKQEKKAFIKISYNCGAPGLQSTQRSPKSGPVSITIICKWFEQFM